MDFLRDLRSSAWLVGALVLNGCAGGQTGDTGGQPEGAQAPPCAEADAEEQMIGLDEDSPSGFKPREVLALFQDKTAPAFVFPLDIEVGNRTLTPEDASNTSEVMVDFEPDGEASYVVYEGACGISGLIIRGTFKVSSLDGSIVLEGEGVLEGTPEQAMLRPVEPELFAGPGAREEDAPVPCFTGEPVMYVASTDGVLEGRLCVEEQLVRFPTACGGFAQVPLDEVIAEELPQPSEALERLRALELEVVWSADDRSPITLSLRAGELACYDVNGYDDAREQIARTWDVALEASASIPDVALVLEGSTGLHGGVTGHSNDIGAVLVVCGDLAEGSIAALEPRLPRALREGRSCLNIYLFEDGDMDIALAVYGEATEGELDSEEDPLEVYETFEVRDVARQAK